MHADDRLKLARHDGFVQADALNAQIDQAIFAAQGWLRDFICEPHPSLGRNGPVCPFVEPAQRTGSLVVRVHLLGITPSTDLVTGIMRGALDEFERIGWQAVNPKLRSLLIIIPDFHDDRLELLDEAQAAVKTEAVRRGLMIGQFHARCPEGAARHSDFLVGRSPVPMVAIRSMAVHDILFLHQWKEWFIEYAHRFGHRYLDASTGLDDLLVQTFHRAASRWNVNHREFDDETLKPEP